jgi:hypothetical protein
MSHAQHDTFESGIGVLAAGNTTSEIQENDPIEVNGVALPVNTVVQGGQGDRHFYPPEVLEQAAGLLEGANIVKNFHEIEGQAPADDVIGEVTDAAFSEGVGLVYQGEILDEAIAQRVAQGYLDVSPTVARALGAYDEDRDARRVDRVEAFRDLAVVQQGQPGAEIDVGPNPAVAALQRDVLSRAFDGGAGDQTDTDTNTMSLDEAKQTLAEEHGIEVDELEARLTTADGGGGGDDGDGDGEPDLADDEVILVES